MQGITRPGPDVFPVDPEELRAQLMRLNQAAAPWHVRDGAPEGVDVVAEWKSTDPYWQPIFTEVSLNGTFMTRIRFHPDVREARSTDRRLAWQPSADSTFSLSKEWESGQLRGMADGTVNGQWYEFDTNDFKNLLKETVTGAGWIYRAVIFRAL